MSDEKYFHMSPVTGKSEKCTGNCDYGENTIHGSSPADVEAKVEASLSEELNGSFGINGVTNQPVSAGGQFVSPVSDNTVSIEGNIDDSFPYPQANDLEKMDTVLESVEAGASTATGVGESMVDEKRTSVKEESRARDGAFYADAAGYLGFVSKTGGESMYDTKEYALTDLGRQYLDADTNERAEIIKSAVENMPAMEAYRSAGCGEEGREAAAELMSEVYSESKAERTAATVHSWAEQIDSYEFADTVSAERKHAGVHIQQAIANDQRRRTEREEKKKEQQKKEDEKFGAQQSNEKPCMECFVLKKTHLFAEGSDVCMDCNE